MSRFSSKTRNALVAAVAVCALSGSALIVPQLAVANVGTISATTALNVRAEPNTSSRVLGVLSSGEQVERRGDPQGEWTPITYRGQNGWVFSQFTALGSISAAAGGTATATDYVNVRRGASTMTASLGTLQIGEQVGITGAIVGGWLPVNYRGNAGYVYAAYVSLDSSGATETPSAPAPATAGTGTATTYVNVRSGPSTTDRVVTVLSTGQSIEIRGAAQGEWTPVRYDGQDAWIFSRYLSVNGATPAPTPEPAPAVPVTSRTAYTNTIVNVRSGPSTNDRIITVLATGQSVEVRGATQGDWTPIRYDGQDAWIFTAYIGDAQTAPQTTTAYTNTGVNLRTGPSIQYQVVRVLDTNTAIELTGVTQDGFSQVLDGGQYRWISTTYISSTRVSTSPAPGSVQGPAAPPADGSTTLNTGGSSGLDTLRDSAKQIVYAVRQNYPYITTIYGVRSDPLPDHPSGRAIDIMMPYGANDQARGDEIAAYLQANANALNIEYLIWRQRIWINGQSGWTWMADRGGITANHYDHIHVTTNY